MNYTIQCSVVATAVIEMAWWTGGMETGNKWLADPEIHIHLATLVFPHSTAIVVSSHAADHTSPVTCSVFSCQVHGNVLDAMPWACFVILSGVDRRTHYTKSNKNNKPFFLYLAWSANPVSRPYTCLVYISTAELKSLFLACYQVHGCNHAMEPAILFSDWWLCRYNDVAGFLLLFCQRIIHLKKKTCVYLKNDMCWCFLFPQRLGWYFSPVLQWENKFLT